MPGRRVRYLKATQRLSVEGKGVIRGRPGLYPFYDSLDVVGEVALQSLKRSAAEFFAGTGIRDIELKWSDHPAEVFDPKFTAPEVHCITIDRHALWVTAHLSVYDPPTAPVLDDLMKEVSSELLQRHGGDLRKVRVESAHATRSTDIEVDFDLPLRGRTVGDAAMVSSALADALKEAAHGATSTWTASEALERGRPILLVGQPESEWMEAKAAPYRLDLEKQKLELAKDVAAFGNSARGGIIVIGLETKRVKSQDMVKRVRLFDLSLVDVHRYQQVLGHYIFPNLEGVEVKVVAIQGNAGYAFIRVPAQPPELKPIFVTGHVVGDRVLSQYLTLPIRQGDSVQYKNAAALHSLLVAGRVAVAESESSRD
jgi:hypothetical protein